MTITTWQIALLVSPTFSLLYSISVQGFLAGWHECSWIAHAPSISLRLAVLVVVIAVAVALDEITVDNDEVHLSSFLPSIILSTLVSIVLVIRTRKIYVSGPKPAADSVAEHAKDKVIMITGSNTGIGKETAKQLLAAGATVIMACRSESRAKDAMEDIFHFIEKNDKKKHASEASTLINNNSKSPRERLFFVQCDVSDYSSVRKSVKAFQDMKLPLHVLINNAGLMMGTRKENNAQNRHELMMSANYLGHFLLTNLLLPILQRNNGRVVVVTSSTYALANDGIDLEDLNCEERKYTMFSQYAQSKLANILMGKELDRREKERFKIESEQQTSGKETTKPVKVYNVHPGLVRTDVVRNMPWYLKYPNMLAALILMALQKAPEAGAYTNVYCATSQNLEDQSGQYFSNSQVFETNEFANDMDKAKALWDISCQMVGLSTTNSEPVNN